MAGRALAAELAEAAAQQPKQEHEQQEHEFKHQAQHQQQEGAENEHFRSLAVRLATHFRNLETKIRAPDDISSQNSTQVQQQATRGRPTHKGTVAWERERIDSVLNTNRMDFGALLLGALEHSSLFYQSSSPSSELFSLLAGQLKQTGEASSAVQSQNPESNGSTSLRSEVMLQLSATVFTCAYSKLSVSLDGGVDVGDVHAWPVEFVRSVVDSCFLRTAGVPVAVQTPRYVGLLAAAAFQGRDLLDARRPEEESVLRPRNKLRVQPDSVVEFAINVLSGVCADIHSLRLHARFLLGLLAFDSGADFARGARKLGPAGTCSNDIVDRVKLRYATSGAQAESLQTAVATRFAHKFSELEGQRSGSRAGPPSQQYCRDAGAMLRATCLFAPLARVRFIFSESPDTLVYLLRASAEVHRMTRHALHAVALHATAADIQVLTTVLRMLRIVFLGAAVRDPSLQRSAQNPEAATFFSGPSVCGFLCDEVIYPMCERNPLQFGENTLKHVVLNEMLPSSKKKVSARRDLHVSTQALLKCVRSIIDSSESTSGKDSDVRDFLSRVSGMCGALSANTSGPPPLEKELVPMFQVERHIFLLLNGLSISPNLLFSFERTIGEILSDLCIHPLMQTKVGKMRVLVRRIVNAIAGQFDWQGCIESFMVHLSQRVSDSSWADRVNAHWTAIDIFCTLQFCLVPTTLYSVDRALSVLRVPCSDVNGFKSNGNWTFSIQRMQSLFVSWWRTDFCPASPAATSSEVERHRRLGDFAFRKLLLLSPPFVYGFHAIDIDEMRWDNTEWNELRSFSKGNGSNDEAPSDFFRDTVLAPACRSLPSQVAEQLQVLRPRTELFRKEVRWSSTPMCDVPILLSNEQSAVYSMIDMWNPKSMTADTSGPHYDLLHPWLIGQIRQFLLWESLGRRGRRKHPDNSVASQIDELLAAFFAKESCRRGLVLTDDVLLAIFEMRTLEYIQQRSALNLTELLVSRAAVYNVTAGDSPEAVPVLTESYDTNRSLLDEIIGLAFIDVDPAVFSQVSSISSLMACRDWSVQVPCGGTRVWTTVSALAKALSTALICFCENESLQSPLLNEERARRLPLANWMMELLTFLLRVKTRLAAVDSNSSDAVVEEYFSCTERAFANLDAQQLKRQALLQEATMAVQQNCLTLPVESMIVVHPSVVPNMSLFYLPLEVFEHIWRESLRMKLLPALARRSPDALLKIATSVDEADKSLWLQHDRGPPSGHTTTDVALTSIGDSGSNLARMPASLLCQSLFSVLLAHPITTFDAVVPSTILAQVQALQRVLWAAPQGAHANEILASGFDILDFFVDHLIVPNIHEVDAAIRGLQMLLTYGSAANTSEGSDFSAKAAGKTWIGAISVLPAWLDENSDNSSRKVKIIRLLLKMLKSRSELRPLGIFHHFTPSDLADLFAFLYDCEKLGQQALAEENRIFLLELSRHICDLCGRTENGSIVGASLVRRAFLANVSVASGTTLLDAAVRSLTKSWGELFRTIEWDALALFRGVLLLLALCPNTANASSFVRMLFKPLVAKAFSLLETQTPEYEWTDALKSREVVGALFCADNTQVADLALTSVDLEQLVVGIGYCFDDARALVTHLLISRDFASRMLSRIDEDFKAVQAFLSSIPVEIASSYRTGIDRLCLIAHQDARFRLSECNESSDVDMLGISSDGSVPFPVNDDVSQTLKSFSSVTSEKLVDAATFRSRVRSFDDFYELLHEQGETVLFEQWIADVRSGIVRHLPLSEAECVSLLQAAIQYASNFEHAGIRPSLMHAATFVDLLQLCSHSCNNAKIAIELVRPAFRWVAFEGRASCRLPFLRRLLLETASSSKDQVSISILDIRNELSALCRSDPIYLPVCDTIWRSVIAEFPLESAVVYEFSSANDASRDIAAFPPSPVDGVIFRFVEKFLLGDVQAQAVSISDPKSIRAATVRTVVDGILSALANSTDPSSHSPSAKMLLLTKWTQAIANVARGVVATTVDAVANQTSSELSSIDAIGHQSKACSTLVNALCLLGRIFRGNAMSDMATFRAADYIAHAEAVGVAISFLLKNAMAIADANELENAGFADGEAFATQMVRLRSGLFMLANSVTRVGTDLLSCASSVDLPRIILSASVCEKKHVVRLFAFLQENSDARTKAGTVHDPSQFLELLCGTLPIPDSDDDHLSRSLGMESSLALLVDDIQRALSAYSFADLESSLESLRARIAQFAEGMGESELCRVLDPVIPSLLSSLHALQGQLDGIRSKVLLIDVLSNSPILDRWSQTLGGELTHAYCSVLEDFAELEESSEVLPWVLELLSPALSIRLLTSCNDVKSRGDVLRALSAVSTVRSPAAVLAAGIVGGTVRATLL